MDSVNSGVWSSCQINEFVDNSQVACLQNGCIYIISQIVRCSFESRLEPLRVYDLKSQKWFIPTFYQWRILGIIGKLLLFQNNREDIYALGLHQMGQSHSLLEAPEWAIHHIEATLPDGRIVKAFWNRQKVEVRDFNGVVFLYDQYRVTRECVNCIHESEIVLDFTIAKDRFIVRTIDVTYPKDGKIETIDPVFPTRPHVSLNSKKLHFNFKGEQIEPLSSVATQDVSDKGIVSDLIAKSQRIGSIDRPFGKQLVPNNLTHEKNNWVAFWKTLIYPFAIR